MSILFRRYLWIDVYEYSIKCFDLLEFLRRRVEKWSAWLFVHEFSFILLTPFVNSLCRKCLMMWDQMCKVTQISFFLSGLPFTTDSRDVRCFNPIWPLWHITMNASLPCVRACCLKVIKQTFCSQFWCLYSHDDGGMFTVIMFVVVCSVLFVGCVPAWCRKEKGKVQSCTFFTVSDKRTRLIFRHHGDQTWNLFSLETRWNWK